jgi:REP element-mobilizing transposase RayT
MVRYRRNLFAGGTFFFTVTLDDRSSSALIDHIGLLRAAFRGTRNLKPFAIDAIVILPDHLHAVWTLPEGDADFSDRWRRIKGAFTRGVVAKGVSVPRDHRGEYALWQGGSGNTPFEMIRILNAALTTSISIRSSTDWCRRPLLGRFPRCIDMFEQVCCLVIGAGMVVQTMPPISVSGRGNPDFASLHPGYE